MTEAATPTSEDAAQREGYMSEVELGLLAEQALTTLADWRDKGIGPPFEMIGGRAWYPLEPAFDWLADHGPEPEIDDASDDDDLPL